VICAREEELRVGVILVGVLEQRERLVELVLRDEDRAVVARRLR
jgi:hypothetical protein